MKLVGEEEAAQPDWQPRVFVLDPFSRFLYEYVGKAKSLLLLSLSERPAGSRRHFESPRFESFPSVFRHLPCLFRSLRSHLSHDQQACSSHVGGGLEACLLPP